MHEPNLDKILISIVVPVYNVEAFLPECIDSLLAQTHPNLEIILVDDGSPDNCGAICDLYAQKNQNIRVIHKENGGLSSARNAGIAAASGTYIGFVDSDDFIDKTMFRRLLEAAVSHHAQIAACGRYLVSEAGDITGQAYTITEETFFNTKAALKEILTSGQLDVAVWDKLFLTSLFEGIAFPVGEINEDAAIIFDLLCKTTGVVHIGTPMYCYRCRSGSITKSGYKPNKIHALDHAEQIYALLEAQHPELLPMAKQYIAYTCCHQLSLILKNKTDLQAYKSHYKRYIRQLDKYFFHLLLNSNIKPVWKLRATLMVLRLYGPMYRLLR